MQLKRKGVEEEPISASKKLRQVSRFDSISARTNSLPSITEEELCPIIEERPFISEVCPVEVQITDVSADDSPPNSTLFITEPDSDERALVLYQPRSSSKSAFPFQYKVSDAVDWFSPSKTFKQNSALSYGSSNNSLAVIPYVAPCDGGGEFTRPYRGSVIIEEITDEDDAETESMVVEDSAPVPMDEETMEPMDTTTTTTVTTPQYPVGTSCDVPYWQRFNPQYTPVMWS